MNKRNYSDSEYNEFCHKNRDRFGLWFVVALILICLSLLAVLKYTWSLDEQRSSKRERVYFKAE